MVETAVSYLVAFLARRAGGLVGRAASDVGSAIDKKLDELYEWVKSKLTGQPTAKLSLELLEESPNGQRQKQLVTDQLTQAVASDNAATDQLSTLVAELDRLRPPGITINGLATAWDVSGTNVGADVEGPLPTGSVVNGTARANTVRDGGETIGAKYRGSA